MKSQHFSETSRIVLALALGLALSNTATAADLGGDCCADLEERVTELEQSAVRHGNRKVSLTIKGAVTEALIFWDDGFAQDKNVIVPDNYGAGFAIYGEGNIRPGLKAGYVIALDVRFGDPADANNGGHFDPGSLQAYNTAGKIAVDQQYVYLDSAHAGRISMGKRNDAYASARNFDGSIADLAAGLKLRNADGSFFGGSWGNLGAGLGDFSGMMVRYDSPSLHGFTFSTSWGDDDLFTYNVGWSGNAGGNAIALAYGHSDFSRFETSNPEFLGETLRLNTLNASYANDMSGLYVQGAYEWADADILPEDVNVWQIKGGWKKDVTGLGATDLFAIYQKAENRATLFDTGDKSKTTGWAIGVVQNIAATDTDLFLRYDNREVNRVNDNGFEEIVPGDITTVTAGMRVKF